MDLLGYVSAAFCLPWAWFAIKFFIPCSQLFKEVDSIISIHWIMQLVSLILIHWIVIYQVDIAIQLLNNWGLVNWTLIVQL